MRSSVAFFLALTIFTSGSIRGQAPSRKANQGEASKPRNDTLKICQGVPIPDGYVVVAYMTSAACPHGAYLLRKQNNYESSLAVNGDSRGATDQTSSGKPSNSAGNNGRSNSPSIGPSSVRSKSTSNPSTGAASSQVASAVTRPRTVASSSKDPASSQTNATA